MNYNNLGKKIAGRRIEKQMTQEELAEKVDVSTVFISQLETSVRKPSLDTICKISDVLDTTIDSLLGREHISSKTEELIHLLSNRTCKEVTMIIEVVRTMCYHFNQK